MKYGSLKSAEIVLYKSIFYVKNRQNFFEKKIIWKYQFRKLFLVKNIFWITLISKIISNFWQTGAPLILKIQLFPLSILIFGQKSCFLGPNIFRIPQPNWYYSAAFKKKRRKEVPWETQRKLLFYSVKGLFESFHPI